MNYGGSFLGKVFYVWWYGYRRHSCSHAHCNVLFFLFWLTLRFYKKKKERKKKNRALPKSALMFHKECQKLLILVYKPCNICHSPDVSLMPLPNIWTNSSLIFDYHSLWMQKMKYTVRDNSRAKLSMQSGNEHWISFEYYGEKEFELRRKELDNN